MWGSPHCEKPSLHRQLASSSVVSNTLANSYVTPRPELIMMRTYFKEWGFSTMIYFNHSCFPMLAIASYDTQAYARDTRETFVDSCDAISESVHLGGCG